MTSELVEKLTSRAISKLEESGKDRILITLAGIPGSGKTTAALNVVTELQKRGIKAVVVGMDGYHYTRVVLEQRIGAEKARKFRGAPYTFDAEGVVELAKQLAEPGTTVRFPTFDHAVKDPVVDGGEVPGNTQVVIFEGLYLHLKEPVWNEVSNSATDTWFAQVDPAVARKRLAQRHLDSGIVTTLEDGELRADSNDLPNGEYITSNSKPAAVTFSTN